MLDNDQVSCWPRVAHMLSDNEGMSACSRFDAAMQMYTIAATASLETHDKLPSYVKHLRLRMFTSLRHIMGFTRRQSWISTQPSKADVG